MVSSNTFSRLGVSSLLFAQAIQGLAIVRKDISGSVRRSGAIKRANAPGLAQPIWLGDDGLHYYTNVSMGTPPQPLTLVLSLDGTTWAPTLPAGTDEKSFCADGKNKVACSYASISGFYIIPGSVTYAPQGDYQTLAIDAEDTINGIKALEHIQLGSTVLANVGIAVANSWDSAPQLSLSTIPTSKTSGPQLLSVLEQANVINTLTYALSFTSVDRKGAKNYTSGEITFGGIDESQFFGELSTFNATNETAAGVLPVSNFYWIDGNGKNVSIVDEGIAAGHLGVGQAALSPYLWLQDSIFEIVISLFSDLKKDKTSGLYSRNCSSPLDIQSLQMSVDGTIITISNDLLFLTTENANEICTLAIRPISEYQTNTTADYILGFPFLRSTYTVFDYTNSQTHIAPRRVVFSSSSSAFIPVGENSDPVSGTGVSLITSIKPATSTISRPLGQTVSSTTPTPSATTSTAPPAATTSVETQYFYHASKNTPNIAAIVGGVIGAVVLLAILIVFYPLMKAHNQRRRRQKARASRARQMSRGSGNEELSPVDSNGDPVEGDDEGDDKDSDEIATAIAVEESKKTAIAGPYAKRESSHRTRDSITVNVTEFGSNSSQSGRNSGSGKSVNTFGENEKSGK
ncbi:hypothetical protein H072_639 [Dactylellina haptotyla CBS 200.50]|uniref:Peptidase A1 domain-containing protein n=1 Tax=Dactylellina haptotyla (strain CBS 200.50) TaxID=1284197 RepID=S8AWR4_DACHA|nr:hypothetical protein H072_639 [Dactylellina haptotyla CBS 200.50]